MRNPVRVILRALARLALAISGIGIAMAQTPDFGVIKSENASFRLELIAENLGIPWGLAFLGNGRALVSERAVGKINLLDLTTGEVTPLAGVPKMFLHEFVDRRFGDVQPGVMDVAVHPDFANNHWVYFAYSMGDETASTLAVDRAKLEGTVLVERENLFEALPHAPAYNHYGCRLVFKDGYLFLTMGERLHMKHSAQDLSTHLGTVIRIHDDGRVPEDNPFAGVEGAKKEIWSYGHRNSQGMVLHPETGVLWENEHGPQGGDEINIIEPGLNYGWPVITYGEEYGGGPIGDGITKHPGMVQPVYYYRPSIGPSGMDFYFGDAFPGWRGDLFVAATGLRHLNRLVIDDTRVIHEERLLQDKEWRVRLVRSGPGGFLYIGVDEGMILRLRPAENED